ncbi:MAG: sugar ABC transporter permease [Chloroflexi bacterium]|nr:sugar ABC transporter permease [Chloroflexota bacterium]
MTTSTTERTSHPAGSQPVAAGRRRRKIQEALTGYLFVLPAAIATFVFGLWPVVAGFYESIKSGSPLTNRYVGLDNYVRSLGSLTYVLLFFLSVILLYVGYRAWSAAYMRWQASGGHLWPYILPGLLAGAGLITLAFNFVTGNETYSWIPTALLLLALGGYYTADSMQAPRENWDARRIAPVWLLLVGVGLVIILGPDIIPNVVPSTLTWLIVAALVVGLAYWLLPYLGRIQTGQYISATLLMGTLMLLAILLSAYSFTQMKEDVEDAQALAALIFNQGVLNARVNVAIDDPEIGGLIPDGEILVEVEVDGEVIEAPLAPEAFSALPIESINQLQTTLSNNQQVAVVLPDGTIAEGTITGLSMGESLEVPLTADDAEVVQERAIYSALTIGEGVIRAGGHTEPVHKQVLATIGFFVGMAAIYTMTYVRRRIDDEEQPRTYRWLHRGRVVMGIVIALLFFYLLGSLALYQQAASAMGALTEEQFRLAYEYVTGSAPRSTLRPSILQAELLYWPQVFLVALGASMIGAAYLVWQSAQRTETKLSFALTILLAILLMIGGWLLISELPQTMRLAGREARDTYDATMRTAMYSLGTVPVQLGLGLLLAYLLFSEVRWGKGLFRVIYFMPYIAPSVATATVFLVIFSLNENSLANQGLGLLGLDPLRWLKEPEGIVRLFYSRILGGDSVNIPAALQGPSLALTTVILYNIWVFAGYNAVVFLAGLGSIPTELYEAAEVDGAGRWARFRNITLPLLSPTTFFLSMLSVIGTFKAFSHIYVLRNQAVGKEIDTMSVHIFQQLYAANDPGYAAALAFSLFGMILILTLVQNRLAREQVFYG